jgi:chemotaxis response regulator CheB
MAERPPTRVLTVDDSAVVQKLLADALRREPEIEAVSGASDPFVAPTQSCSTSPI